MASEAVAPPQQGAFTDGAKALGGPSNAAWGPGEGERPGSCFGVGDSEYGMFQCL